MIAYLLVEGVNVAPWTPHGTRTVTPTYHGVFATEALADAARIALGRRGDYRVVPVAIDPSVVSLAESRTAELAAMWT